MVQYVVGGLINNTFKACWNPRVFWVVCLVSLLCLSGSTRLGATDVLCARVKIEILQELTQERQAFEALMKITNPLESFALEDLATELIFKDAKGQEIRATSDPNARDARFFVRVYDTQGVQNVNDLGDSRLSGQVAASSEAKIKWLIIPAPGAADSAQGSLYFVGAKLQYRYGGELAELTVAEDSIVVKPLPQLQLNYFLTEEVFGDDAFTLETEPPEPYTLGIRVTNQGKGAAHKVQLDSAQPRIVENKQGLAIGFRITDSYVDDQAKEPVLLLNFGDIAPNSHRMGRWLMETTLSGKFIEFNAKVAHAAELGGDLTSIISDAKTHFLVKDVRVDLPGRDTISDFLGYPAALNKRSLRVYESQRLAQQYSECLDCAPVAQLQATLARLPQSVAGFSYQLTPSTRPKGFGFIKVGDPYRGQQVLRQAVRADGTTLLKQNAWLGRERNEDKVHFNYFIYLFDHAIAEHYRLSFAQAAEVPQAPVITALSDKTTVEGGQLEFLVTASDPNGTVPNLRLETPPLGALFEVIDQNGGNSQGRFRWSPRVGQAGRYPVTFTASDGTLQTQAAVTIQVKGPGNDDEDPLPGDGESQSPDGSDANKGGPGSGTGGPSGSGGQPSGPNAKQGVDVLLAPHILAPKVGAHVQDDNPRLVIINSTHRPEVAVTYDFEVFADAALSEAPIGQWSQIAETPDTTALSLTQLQTPLVEDHTYYWRVRANSTRGHSLWQYGQFTLNAQNQVPKAAILSYPSDGVRVPIKRPTLSFYAAQDPDQESVRHSIQVFEGNQTTPWLELAELPLQPGRTLGRWSLPRKLRDNVTYRWQVTATDSQGAVRVSDSAHFAYQAERQRIKQAPIIVSPTHKMLVKEANAWLHWVVEVDSQHAGLEYDLQWSPSANFDRDLQAFNRLPSADSLARGLPIPVGHLENRSLHWRVRATQDDAASDWKHAQFQINLVNEPPATPTLANPIDQAVAPTLTPVLHVRATEDPDGDKLSYEFQLFRDPDLKYSVAEGRSDRLTWQVPSPLSDQQTYYWRAYALDAEGARSAWSQTAAFSVQQPAQSQPPQWRFVSPQEDLTVTEGAVAIQWVDEDLDANARIRLWYEDGTGETGVITDGLAADQDGPFDRLLWHVSGLKAGTYTLKALIEDDQHRVEATAPGRIIVSTPAKANLLRLTSNTTDPLDEAGSKTVQFSISLTQAPKKVPGDAAFVMIPLSVSDASELRIQSVRQQGERQPKNYLYFNRNTWDQPYEVTLTGKPDCIADGQQSSELVLGQATSTDPEFQGWNPPNATVIVADDQQGHAAVSVCQLQLIAQSQAEDNTLVGQYRVSVMNHSQEVLPQVSAQAQARSPNLVVEGGLLHFNQLQPNQPVFSSDLLRLQSSSGRPADLHQLQWDFQALPSKKNTEPPAVDKPATTPSTEDNASPTTPSAAADTPSESSQSDNKGGGALYSLWTLFLLLLLLPTLILRLKNVRGD